MKKVILFLLIILYVPIFVNAETITYEVCESGCEYSNLQAVSGVINNMPNRSDKDIIINVNSNLSRGYAAYGETKSLTINGNNYTINGFDVSIEADTITLKDINAPSNSEFGINYPKHLKLENTILNHIVFMPSEEENEKTLNLNNVLELDETSINHLSFLMFFGNVEMKNMNFQNVSLTFYMGQVNINNSKIKSISNGGSTINIYNSTFDIIKYINISSEEEYMNLYTNGELNNYNVKDMNYSEGMSSNTYIQFDKEAKLKPDDKLNLVDYLDYYTDNKEISYTIEDESIAKIENKELIGLKPGNTKVKVTTDEGHVVYNIDLTVYKTEEKSVTMKAQNKLKLNSVFKDLDISSLSDDVWEISNPSVAKVVNGEIISLAKGETDIVATINGVKYVYHLTVSDTLVSKEVKVPITGKNIKLWIIVVTILLLSVIGACSYILIKKK